MNVRCGRLLLVDLRGVLAEGAYGRTVSRLSDNLWSFLDEELWRPVVDGTWDPVCRQVMEQLLGDAERMRRWGGRS